MEPDTAGGVAVQLMPVGEGRHPFATMVHALCDAVAAAPDRVAIRQGERSLTYREYGRCVAGLAAQLDAVGVAGERVAVVLPNGPEMAVAAFATLSAGAQVALLNPAYPAAELAPLLADAAPAAVLTFAGAAPATAGASGGASPQGGQAAGREASAAARFAAERGLPLFTLDAGGFTLDRWRDDASLSVLDRPRPRPDDLATLMYTGGTTGVPKGANHTHRTLMLTVQAMEACWPTRIDTEVWLTVAPMFHIWGLLMGLMCPVYGRATVIVAGPFRPDAVVEAMARYRVSVFSGGPAAIYAGLLASPVLGTADLSALRVCPGGGSPFPANVLEAWQRATGVPVREAFGMTELAPITGQPPGREPRPGSVGTPASLVELRIAEDGQTRPLPPGTTGEVLVRGPHLFRGYRNRPDETAAAMADGWLRTGDLGRLDEDGYLYIVDRKKDMILVGGFNVFPREIDEVLASHPDVRQSVTIGVPDDRKGELPVSFVVPEDGRTPDVDALHRHCADRLVRYKLPSAITVVPQIPHTPANKVDRPALRRRWQACLATV